MTEAAKLSEKVMLCSICLASKQKTMAAPTQVEAPAKKESISGNIHSSSSLLLVIIEDETDSEDRMPSEEGMAMFASFGI